MCLLHTMVGELEWTHKVTDKSEEMRVFATIFPMDDLLLTFKKRTDYAAPAVAAAS
jgi:sterol 22-desaturase